VHQAEEAPEWFAAAINTEAEKLSFSVDGVLISARAWGPVGPGIVLVHGTAAHAHWWDHIAPTLAKETRVIAVDLSGHGDSGKAETYDYQQWSRQVSEAAIHGGVVGPALLVGHSMGAWVALDAAARFPDNFDGVVAFDPPDAEFMGETLSHLVRFSRAQHRLYPTLEAGAARFATTPREVGLLPYVERHVARNSLKESTGGWSWKFDPRIYARPGPLTSVAGVANVPVALVRSELGILTEAGAAAIEKYVPGPVTTTLMRDAVHHVILQKPAEVIEVVRAARER
jgi:pimeloyl-ACP methyl ester carboxylesterase